MQSLRGKEAKDRFFKDYTDIKVLDYAVVLNGNSKKNQCGGKLTDKYYRFSAICKKTNKKEYFFLGYDCGKQIISRLNITYSIRLFNPLLSTNQQQYNKNTTNDANKEANSTPEMTPLEYELFCLIHLMCEGIGFKQTDIIDNIKFKLLNNPHKEPHPGDFEALNTILTKWHTSIPEIIEKLQNNNNKLKKFDFTKSENYLKEYHAKQKHINKKILFCVKYGD